MDDFGSAIGQLGGFLGMGFNQMGQNQQNYNTQQFMAMQHSNQRNLNEQMQKIQQENWDYTNYENQVKHLKNAGLNVGLLYGQGGAGGSTMGGASGGSAAMGSAAQNNTPQVMAQMLQAMMMKSEIAKNESEANRNNADADKKRGVDTANTQADTQVKEMTTKNMELQNNLQSRSMEDVLDTIKYNRDTAVANSSKAITEANVSASTKQAQIDKINAEAINEAFKLTLMKADVNLKDEQARAITQELAQEWERLSIEVDKVGTMKMKNAIDEFTAKINAKLGQGNLQMRQIEAGLNGMGKLLNRGVNVNNSGPRNTTVHNY
jgi:hypothetical protein